MIKLYRLTERPSLALLALLLVACSAPPDDSVAVSDAWVRLPVPGRDIMVGYFELNNPTAAPVTLTGARSDQARSVELHTMRSDGDMMRMRPLERLTVAAGQRAQFAPGGHHLMIFGGTAVAGDVMTITFEFDGGLTVDAAFEVRPFEGANPS